MKRAKPFILIGIIITLIALIFTVLSITVIKMPFRIPKINEQSLAVDYSSQNNIMQQWENVRIYEPVKAHETVEEIIESVGDAIDEQSEKDFYKIFDELDKSVFDAYLEENKIAKNYETLFIDKADKTGVGTGIKDKSGNTILAVDSLNKVILLGQETESGAKVVIAKVKNPKQVGLSVVNDLNYWSKASEHAKSEKAIIAVNANNYSWNDAGKYGTSIGLIKRNNVLIRKAKTLENVVGLDKDGKIRFATDENSVSNIYSGIENRKPLIKDGVSRITDNTTRLARTGIGQLKDNTIVFIQIAGGAAGESNKGASEKEIIKIMEALGVVNGAELSSGQKSIIYWNNKILNETTGYADDGVKLPTAFVVRPNTDNQEKVAKTPTQTDKPASEQTTEADGEQVKEESSETVNTSINNDTLVDSTEDTVEN